jgi:lipopolysaccharide export LptBFGC system permease protein LptF
MFPLLPMLFLGGFLFTSVLIVVVRYLNKQKLKEIIKKNEKKQKEVFSMKIKESKMKGNYNKINVGLYDENKNEIKEIVIQANNIGSDIQVGTMVYL